MGVETFTLDTGPDGKAMMAINLRCVENIDLDARDIQNYAGASK